MRLFRIAIVSIIAVLAASSAQAEVKYQYVAAPASVKLKTGQKAKISIYLEETLTEKSNTFIGLPNKDRPASKIGLFSAGFKIFREGTVDDGGSNITDVTGQTNPGGGFAGGLGLPIQKTAKMVEFGGGQTVSLNAVQGAQPIVVNPKTRRILLATVEITGGTADSTFNVTNFNKSKGNTLTFTDLTGGKKATDRINLDDDSPASPDIPEFKGARDQNFEIRVYAVK